MFEEEVEFNCFLLWKLAYPKHFYAHSPYTLDISRAAEIEVECFRGMWVMIVQHRAAPITNKI